VAQQLLVLTSECVNRVNNQHPVYNHTYYVTILMVTYFVFFIGYETTDVDTIKGACCVVINVSCMEDCPSS
jgi:hypothetical protein